MIEPDVSGRAGVGGGAERVVSGGAVGGAIVFAVSAGAGRRIGDSGGGGAFPSRCAL
jgi:hypothetical protein